MTLDRNQPPARDLLDLTRLTSARLRQDPFRWARLKGLVKRRDLETLCREFPTSGFQEVAGYSQDKQYRMFCRTILPRGQRQLVADQSLPSVWGRFCAAFVGRTYRVAMERLTGLSLNAHKLEINLWVYGPDCWLAPHCDKPSKAVSHIFYFSPSWHASWGGHLRILRSRDISDWVEQIPPVAGDSVVLVRSDHSWHAVTPVSGIPEGPRRSLQVIFWTPGQLE